MTASSSTPTGVSGSPVSAGSSSSSESDWPAELAGRLELVVSTVRDKTTVPVVMLARGVVFGVMVGVLGAVLLIALVIGIVRICDVYLPFHPVGRRVWVTYAGGSAILLASGALLWRKSRPRSV